MGKVTVILILLLCSMSQLRIIRCFRQRFQLTKSTRPFFLQKESSLSSDSGKDDDTIRYDQLVGSSKVFLSSIKARSANSRVLTFDESTALTGLIKHHLPNLKATDLLVLMSFISDLKLGSSANKHSQELLSLLKRIADESTKFSDDQMHKMFLAMVNAKIRWDSITENLVLSDRFNELLLRGDGKLYSEMLWCIGSMGGEWRSLSTGSKEAVIEGLESTLFNITPYTLSSVLWSLAKTGIKWSQLKNVGSSVLRAISRIAEITSPQQSSKILWSLGQMSMDSGTIDINVLNKLLANVGKIKKSQTGNAVMSSQALVGLAKMGLQWEEMPKIMQNMWIDQSIRVLQSGNDRGVVNAIWACGTVSMELLDQPISVQNIVVQKTALVLGKSSAWGFANAVWGISKVAYSWKDMDRSLQDSILMNIVRLQSEMNAVDVGTILWSLAELDAPLDGLPKYAFDAIMVALLRALPRIKAQDLSKSIWGLSGAGVSWDLLPERIKWEINIALRRVEEELSPQDVANCAYGLCVMSFDIDNPYDAAFRGAHEVLLNRIRSAGRGLQITTPERLSAMDHGEATGFVVSALPLVKEKEQLKIFSHYLQVMKFVTDPQRIPADILAPSFGWNPLNLPCDSGKVFVGNPTESRLQSRVFSALESRLREQSSSGTKFEVVSEVSSFAGVFPVDAAIIRNGKILALLEVDGPQHYRPFDGSLRRKDKLKCAMYTKKHPNSIFHRIRWDEENKIGADILVDEIVRDLIEKAGKENWFTSSFGNVRRTFEDLMSWGLRNSKDEFS